ncbi:glycosyltransferase family 4 protein [Flavobacterium sp. SM15]|uniref:glycosyltransferase family 4 protein n=1 Tax=Flavobacterium sp. SM15 TaxID=2908005 RepID=UPI001EDB744E|nr:glycosyltransferase family 4 protein [Flavobacterium sp. SM15]MCG2610368.1 glycosyltransferase family 4 protein [Flavobacterium sp. SM15]
MKVIVFALENLTLTGGNLYDSLLYRTMKQNQDLSITFYKPKVHKGGFAFKKFITPFLELKWLKKVNQADNFFWNSVDAYHCFLLVFVLRVFFPKKKVFILHHHYKFLEMKGVKRTVFRFFEVNFLRMANTIVIPSPYILDQTKKLLPSNKVSYLEIAFQDKNNAGRSSVNKGQMVFVGNIEPRKGLHLLVESLRLLKKENVAFQVNILGSVIDTNYYNDLVQKVKEYDLHANVIFHGRVSDEQKDSFLSTSELCVFPSLLEGYGMAIIEAMSFGLPVIAFDNSAMPYSIKNGYNGLLAKNEDIQNLKDKIKQTLVDSTLSEKLSNGAFETFSKCRKLPVLIQEMKEFTMELNR